MTDQVESLEVGFQDGVSAGAKAATDNLKGLGDAAVVAEGKAARAGKGIKQATDEAAAGAAAAKKAIGDLGGEVDRTTEKVARHSQTAEQLANKFDRAKREAGAVAKAIAPYQRALDDLEKSSASAAEKDALRATITAKMEAATEKARAAVARYFKDVEAGAAAANASAGGLSAGMAAMTASANSWAGGLGKVYESANSAAGGLNGAARALAGLNAGLQSGHTSFAEWTAGARGLEASLRGVSAAQKAINDSTGVSRQNVNTATIGTLKHAVTGNAAPTGTTLGLVTGDAEASAKRLADLEAAFASADEEMDRYRASLGLVDVAQRKYEAGLADLQAAIRRTGIEEAEATRLLTAYAAAHDPAEAAARKTAADDQAGRTRIAAIKEQAANAWEAQMAMDAWGAREAKVKLASDWEGILAVESYAQKDRIAQTKAQVAAAWEAQIAMDEWGAAEAKAKLAAEWEASMAFPDKKPFGIYDTGFQQDRAEFDSLFAASKKYEDQLNRLNAAHASGAVPNYEAALEELNAEFDRATGQSKNLADQQKVTADATARTVAENAKLAASYNQVMGAVDPAIAAEQRYQKALADLRAGAAAAGVSMDQLAADEAKLTAAISPAAIAAKKEEEALRTLVTGLDRTWGATDKLAERQKMLDKAYHEGVNGVRLSREEHERFSRALRDQHELATRATNSTKLAAHEAVNLGYQIQDFGVQISSGQGFLIPFIQQAPQAVGAVGGMSRMMALLTSTTALTVMGFGSLALGFGIVMGRAVTIQAELREFNTLLKATGDQAGLTAEQMRGVTEGMMGGGASREEANAVVKNLVATRRRIGEGLAKDVGSLSIDMGTVFGGTTEAGKRLTEWVTTGVKGLREMAAETGALSVAQYEAARAAYEHGDQEKALAIAIGALKDRFAGLHRESLSPAEQAMEDLRHAYNDLVNTAAEHPVVINITVVGAEVLREISKFIKDPANFQFPTVSKNTEFPNPFGWFIGLASQPKTTPSEGASPAPAGTPIPGRKPTQQDGMPLAEALALSDLTKANDKLLGAMQRVGAERAIETARVQAEIAAINAGKSPKAAELEGVQAARMARAQLVQAMDDNARAAAADVAGNELMGRAYGVSSAAVREATLHQKAMAEAARGTIESYDQIVARLRAVDDAQRAVQAAQYDATLRQQTEDADRLAGAWGRGADAAREAALANEVLAEARKRGLDPTRDAGEIGNIGAGVWARDQAQRTQQFSQMASEQRRAVDLANAEYGMLGASNAERAKTVAMLQVANDLRDRGADLTDAGTKAYIEQAGELARVNSQLQDAAQNASNITQPITTGLEDIIVGAKGAGDAVKALGEDLKRIAARQLITKPFETAVSGALTRLMSGGISVANDNRPTPANDPGGLDRLITTVKGGLGSSSSNAMWVQMASGSAAYDIGAMFNGSPMPVAIKDAAGLEGIIQGAATKYGVDPAIIKGIVERESSWRADAVNKTSGAAGLMQLMPANIRAYGVTNAFDPAQNIETGTRILKEHLVRAGGDLDKALSTYSGHITKDGSAYVSAVKASAETYRQAGAGLRLVVDNTQGVTAAQESHLQAMLDAVPVQRTVTSGAQSLTAAQDSLIASVLGTSKANDAAMQVVDVQTRSIGTLGANAISVAEGLSDAADGASSLADASQDSSNILLRGAQSVYSGFTSILGSLWNSVSGLFGGGGSSVAVGSSKAAQANPLGSLSQVGQIASAGQSAYTAFTGGYASMGTNAGMWLAESSLGNSLGLSTAYPMMSSSGQVGTIYAANASGSAMAGTMGQMAAGLPFGALGGIGGGFIGTATNSKALGGLSGAALGAGSALAYEAIFGAGAAGGPWGMAAAAVVAAVMGMLGTTKKSVGPNGEAILSASDTGFAVSRSLTDNGGDESKTAQLGTAASTALNAIVSAVATKFSPNSDGEFGSVRFMEATGKYTSRVGGVDQEFANAELAMTDFLRRTVKLYSGTGELSGLNDDVRKALDTSKAKTAEDFAADLEFASGFRKQFDVMNASMDPTSNQIKEFTEASKALGESVKENITDWVAKGRELELATESELVTAARRGIEAMLGLGAVAQPLVGMAAVTKQAEIQFEAFRPALASLGYTVEEVADLATRYTAKMEGAYSDAVGLLQRQGGVQIAALDGRGKGLSAADTFRAGGATVEAVTAPAFAAITDGLDGLTAAARRGALTYADVETSWVTLNRAVYDGVLTAEQYTTAVGMLTTAYQDSQQVLSTLRQAWTTVEAITDPGRQQTAGDVLDGALVRSDASGVPAFRDTLDGLFGSIRGGTASTADLARTYETAADLFRAGTITGEQFNAVVSSMVENWNKATEAASYNADITTRMFAAVGADRFAGLLALDQQQKTELDAAEAKGYDTTALRQVQAAERGQKSFDLARTDVLEWYDREIAAKQEMVTSLQDGAVKIAQIARQFQQAADSIKLSEDAPISPQERLAEAVRQWNVALGTVRSDTATDSEKDSARSMLTQLGQTLVSIEKTNSAGTARTLYDEVLKVFGELGDVTGLGVDTADKQLQTANDSLKELQKARTEAASIGQRQLGSLDSLVSIMNQSYSLWQASLVPANQNTGTTASATLEQMLKGLTTGTLGGIVDWAKAQGPATTQKVLMAADKQLGWENNPYRYSASADVAGLGGQMSSADWMSILKSVGYGGSGDAWEINAWIAAYGKKAEYEAAMKAWAHNAGIPGFAVGTMATPPGAVWVGERGPELMWQSGGAAVASSADSLRIAGLYESAAAANDRWAAGNVSNFRPAAPARPERSNDRDAAILAELRRLNERIAELQKALHDEEGSAQNQRGVLLTKLIKTVEALAAELTEQKQRLSA